MNNSKDNSLEQKFITGKFKPQYSKVDFTINLGLDIILVIVTVIFVCEVFKFANADLGVLLISAILIPLLDYVILLSPYQQYTENYYIEFEDENTLNGFKLFYAKKEVAVSYKINEEGKIVFDQEDKLKCFNYADGSRMSSLRKRRIINYFTAWLKDKDLISA